MRIRVLALLASLAAACNPTKSGPRAPGGTTLTCDNVVQDPIAALVDAGMVQDLGTLAVGSNVQFTIPTGTSSFFIVSQEVGKTAPATITAGTTLLPNAVVPTNLRGPDFLTYYDDFALFPMNTIGGSTYAYYDLTTWLAVDQGFQPVVGVLPFPTTSGGLSKLQSGGQVAPGTWSFTLNDWANNCPFASCPATSHAGQYRVQVVKVPSSGTAIPDPGTRTLDLEVYLATDPSLSQLPSAAAANGSAQAARWKLVLSRFLGNAGIVLGTVTYHDLSPTQLAKYAPNGSVDITSSDPCGNLDQLFTTATTRSRAVHVFLADHLAQGTPTGNTRIAGIDGSIPGPSGYPGTIASGALVGLEDLGAVSGGATCTGSAATNIHSCGTDRVAYVAAHEVGHWLGLFHTTEQDGAFFDPLTDTSVCLCYQCAAAAEKANCDEVPGTKGTTVVFNDVCNGAGATCGGGENLMFWLLDPGDAVRPVVSTGALSPQQGQVARLNPAVH